MQSIHPAMNHAAPQMGAQLCSLRGSGVVRAEHRVPSGGTPHAAQGMQLAKLVARGSPRCCPAVLPGGYATTIGSGACRGLQGLIHVRANLCLVLARGCWDSFVLV